MPAPAPASRSQPRGSALRRVLSWALAVGAFAFVAWAVPVRDRFWDPRVPASTHVAVSRDDAGCQLQLASGAVRLSPAACAQLRCEPGVLSTFERARPAVIVGLFALYLSGTLAWAARWRALLGFAGVDLRLLHVWRISIEAQAGGILLPGGIGGDALRVASVLALPDRPGEPRSSATLVIASVLLDRAVGLALIAAVAAAMGLASGGVGGGPLVAVLAAIPLAILAGTIVLRRAPLQRVPLITQGRIGTVVAPVLAYIRDPRAPRAIAYAAGLSVVVAAVQFGVIRGLLFGLGTAPVQERWIYVGAAMAFIVAALPGLPGAWGTADATYVVFFGLAGVAPGAAIGVCLTFRLFWYLLGMAGAILYVARPRPVAVASASDPAARP